MPNFRTHVLSGLALYPIVVAIAVALPKYFSSSTTVLSAGYLLFVLGADLPDVDHKDAIIHKGIKALISASVGSASSIYWVNFLSKHPLPNLQIAIILAWIAGSIEAILTWYVVEILTPKHRGSVHSVTAALVYAGGVWLVGWFLLQLSFKELNTLALSAFAGYLLHLILDGVVKAV